LDAAQCDFNSGAPLKTSASWGGARAHSGGPRPGFGGPQPGSGRPRKAEQPQRVIQSHPIGERWYVVEHAPGAGHRVLRDIIEGESRVGREPRPGYRAEMPMIAARRLRRGVWTIEHIAMFPGYVMLCFDAAVDDWAPIRHIEGVAQLFMTKSMRPIPLPVGFVEWLVSTAAERLSLRASRMVARVPGTKLMVADGPFVSHPAVTVECDGINTTADVEFFGRTIPITLPYAAFCVRV
jgi:transcription antitermination factor NusG